MGVKPHYQLYDILNQLIFDLFIAYLILNFFSVHYPFQIVAFILLICGSEWITQLHP
jgi:hypothetical protein